VVLMVLDAVVATNQLADHGAGPNACVEATLTGARFDEGDELGALLIGEKGSSPWPLCRAETVEALGVVPL